MEINIKMENCRFFVDEEKRTVVCVIEDTSKLLWHFFNLGVCDPQKASVRFRPSSALMQKLTLPNRFVGKCVCSKDDEWNEEVGRIIAFDRAKYKLNTSFFKRAQLFINEIDAELGDMITTVNEYGMRLEHGAEKRKEHILKINPDFKEE